MIWTMPRPVTQWVAALLALGAAGAFAMGIVNAPDRGGRLPGERPAGRGGLQPAMAINAADATPLAQERIEAPPKPAPKATNANANADDEDNADDSGDQAVNATPPAKAANATVPSPPATTTPPPDAPAPSAPPPEEPPH
jgi:hypothetical protein